MLRSEAPVDMRAFAHVAAHDLKAPLHGVATLVELLGEDFAEALGDRGREDLQLLRRLAERGVALVDGLKKFTTAASAPLAMGRLDVGELAARAVQSAAQQHGVVVQPGPAGHFPAVIGDRVLVSVLLEQLVQNAVVFRDPGACWVEVRHADDVAADQVPVGHVAFAVRDRGIGIAARHLGDVFDMFKRLHGPDGYGGGAGCGLALAREIAGRHGGVIWAEAADGGTRFLFTLPAAEARP